MKVKVQDDRDHLLISKTPQDPGHQRTRMALLILVCFFLSGMTALIYEVVWMRLISRIIGGAPFAVSTILVVFMGGLGIGLYAQAAKLAKAKNDPVAMGILGKNVK